MYAEVLNDLDLERVSAGLSKGGQGGQQQPPAGQGGSCSGGCGR